MSALRDAFIQKNLLRIRRSPFPPGIITLPPSPNYHPNGDVNWLNEPTLPPSAAITLDGVSGQTIQFLHIDGAVGNGITLNNCSNIIIENCLITNTGLDAIRAYNSGGVTVRNCKMTNINTTNSAGVGYGMFVYFGIDDMLFLNNWVEDAAGGVHIQQCTGHDNYQIRDSFFKNMSLPPATLGTGQDIQIYASQQMTNVVIDNNTAIGIWGQNNYEDHINVNESGGTVASPMLITNNKFKGGGPSTSGGGIIIVDNGNTFHGNITVDNNILIDPGHYGVGLVGGVNNIITNNKIFSSLNYPGIAAADRPIQVYRQSTYGPGNMHSCTVGGVGNENLALFYAGQYNDPPAVNGPWYPSYGSPDLQAPNHGETVNVDPTGWANNDWNYTAWDNDVGYTALAFTETYEYVAP